ncbi:MAG: hypothetical protein J5855_03980 [Mailhella sp.]|nr:hypothetical protein [Mailhella sp.]
MATDITGVTGFDQTIYDNLVIQYTKATGKTQADLDGILMDKIDGGASFKDAAAQIRADLPSLPKPIITKSDITTYATLPSFGANYLAMITDVAAEQRRQNAQVKAMSTEEMIAKINEQAETIREKAIVQLVSGIVTGTVSIVQGGAALGMSAVGTAKIAKAGPETMQAANAALNNKIASFNSIMGGSNNILGSIGQFVATQYDAKLKEQEGDVERIRATQQQLDSLDENLKALIQKALASQDAIQQNMNQTRTRILG